MSSNDYDVVPANNSCASQLNKQLIVTTPGTPTTHNLTLVNSVQQQHIEDSKYDNTSNIQVQPLYGGNHMKNFYVKIDKKKHEINAKNAKDAINKLLKNKTFKNEKYIQLTYKNKTNLYCIIPNL